MPGYNYATPGTYFLTACTKGFYCLFGQIDDGNWQPNRFGQIVEDCWLNLPNHYPAISLDEFCVMPNHFHAVIHLEQGTRPLPEIVRGFKTFSARRINEARRSPGSKVWQRSFYDHIVRSEADLQRIRQYVFDNPGNWNQGRGDSDSVGEGLKPSPTNRGAL